MKIIYIITFFFFTTSLYADWRNQAAAKTLNDISKKTTKFVSGLIPGEGITEVEIDYTENIDNNFQFKILGVRDIIPAENSNFFTQFSLQNQEVNNDDRIVGNLGLGYRFLVPDQSKMIGFNVFYDEDFTENHKRAGYGLEAKAANLDFNYNFYQKASKQKLINGTNEQVLNGREFNLSSQLPYVSWAKFNLKDYIWETDLGANDTKGNVYSLEMALTQSINLDLLENDPSGKGESENSIKLTFVHPPRNSRTATTDGFFSREAFAKQNMQEKLKGKVRRTNSLAVEIQGSIIATRAP